ncbi:MAG: hypothetical protein CSA72_10580 [Rhodobacterales bacterium]|nr:MAG: hypothetical protein CSA72_10580 [Rhodobacterales bacterium]
MMQAEVRALLVTDPAIGNLVADRVEWGSSSDGATMPQIILTVVSEVTGYTLDGEGGLTVWRVQIDALSDDYDQSVMLGRAVKSRLSGHRGGNCRGAFAVLGREDSARDKVSGQRVYRSQRDFKIIMQEQDR